MKDLSEDPQSQLTWITVEDREVLHFKPTGGKSDALFNVSQFIGMVTPRPNDSVLFLVDLSAASFFAEATLEWQRADGLLLSRCARIATFGTAKLIRAASEVFLSLAESSSVPLALKTRMFDLESDARHWLLHGKLGR